TNCPQLDNNQIHVKSRHAKNHPGRKTDVSDAQWLAELGAHGLVRGSFIPPWPIRDLRDYTRQRTLLVGSRSKEIQQLEKLIESTGRSEERRVGKEGSRGGSEHEGKKSRV